MGLKKRSFSLTGHRTSVALEEEFWAVLNANAARENKSLAALVAQIERSPRRRTPARERPAGFTPFAHRS